MSKIVLQTRDLKLLNILNRFELMTTKQIQNLVFKDMQYTTMLRRLRLLESKKYIKQGVILDNYSRTWQLDFKSGDVLENAKIYNFGNRNTIQHDTKVTDLRLKLESIGLGYDWISGFEIKAKAFKNLKHRAQYQINPDGLMIEALDDEPIAIAIELELTIKSKTRYLKILREYAKSPQIGGVWYFVQSHSMIKSMIDISNRYGIRLNKFWFSLIDDVLNQNELKIFSVANSGWSLVTDFKLKNLNKQTKTAHDSGNGVSSLDEEKLEAKNAVNLSESLSKNNFDTASGDKSNLPDHTPPT